MKTRGVATGVYRYIYPPIYASDENPSDLAYFYQSQEASSAKEYAITTIAREEFVVHGY